MALHVSAGTALEPSLHLAVTLNCCDAPGATVVTNGDIDRLVSTAGGGSTDACAVSATPQVHAAMIRKLPATDPAWNTPLLLIDPPVADQLTAYGRAWPSLHVSVAANDADAPAAITLDLGVTAIAVTCGASMFTGTAARTEPPACVAVTVYAPAADPAVNRPLAVIVPPVADQVTAGMAWLVSLQVALALNCTVPPLDVFTAAGVTANAVSVAGAAVITTRAVALNAFPAGSLIDPVTTNVPAAAPAVYAPPVDTEPPVALQAAFPSAGCCRSWWRRVATTRSHRAPG